MTDSDPREFRLSKDQVDYLLRRDELPGDLRRELTPGRAATVSFVRSKRDELVEQLATRLQRAGFDGDWEPTEEGTMIESLIDVLTAPRANK